MFDSRNPQRSQPKPHAQEKKSPEQVAIDKLRISIDRQEKSIRTLRLAQGGALENKRSDLEYVRRNWFNPAQVFTVIGKAVEHMVDGDQAKQYQAQAQALEKSVTHARKQLAALCKVQKNAADAEKKGDHKSAQQLRQQVEVGTKREREGLVRDRQGTRDALRKSNERYQGQLSKIGAAHKIAADYNDLRAGGAKITRDVAIAAGGIVAAVPSSGGSLVLSAGFILAAGTAANVGEQGSSVAVGQKTKKQAVEDGVKQLGKDASGAAMVYVGGSAAGAIGNRMLGVVAAEGVVPTLARQVGARAVGSFVSTSINNGISATQRVVVQGEHLTADDAKAYALNYPFNAAASALGVRTGATLYDPASTVRERATAFTVDAVASGALSIGQSYATTGQINPTSLGSALTSLGQNYIGTRGIGVSPRPAAAPVSRGQTTPPVEGEFATPLTKGSPPVRIPRGLVIRGETPDYDQVPVQIPKFNPGRVAVTPQRELVGVQAGGRVPFRISNSAAGGDPEEIRLGQMGSHNDGHESQGSGTGAPSARGPSTPPPAQPPSRSTGGPGGEEEPIHVSWILSAINGRITASLTKLRDPKVDAGTEKDAHADLIDHASRIGAMREKNAGDPSPKIRGALKQQADDRWEEFKAVIDGFIAGQPITPKNNHERWLSDAIGEDAQARRVAIQFKSGHHVLSSESEGRKDYTPRHMLHDLYDLKQNPERQKEMTPILQRLVDHLHAQGYTPEQLRERFGGINGSTSSFRNNLYLNYYEPDQAPTPAQPVSTQTPPPISKQTQTLVQPQRPAQREPTILEVDPTYFNDARRTSTLKSCNAANRQAVVERELSRAHEQALDLSKATPAQKLAVRNHAITFIRYAAENNVSLSKTAIEHAQQFNSWLKGSLPSEQARILNGWIEKLSGN